MTRGFFFFATVFLSLKLCDFYLFYGGCSLEFLVRVAGMF